MQQRRFTPGPLFVVIFVLPVMLWAGTASPAELRTKLRWSAASESYEFDTGQIFGCIEPYRHYHGIVGLVHRDVKLDVIRPRKAFLNAEYYLRPGSGTQMLPRRISSAGRTTHEVREDRVVIRFPPEPQFALAMDLAYRPHGDAIDMQMKISPGKDIPQFEIFFASYVAEAFSQTWVPLKGEEGSRKWTQLDNRKVINNTFGVVRDDSEYGLLNDGRWGKPLAEQLHKTVEARPFDRPILVARDPQTGLTLVFLCDPKKTSYLGGQYHGWDTAHDWCFGSDLVAGRPLIASARMIYRRFAAGESMFPEIDREWASFVDWLGGR